MHDPQDPEDAAATSDPFGSTKVNGGEQNLNRISMKWFSWLSVCEWQRYTMLMLFVFVFEVSAVYRYVVNFPEVADAMCSIANLCIYCSCW